MRDGNGRTYAKLHVHRDMGKAGVSAPAPGYEGTEDSWQRMSVHKVTHDSKERRYTESHVIANQEGTQSRT